MKRVYLMAVVLLMCFTMACTTSVVPPGVTIIKLGTDGSTQIYTAGKYTSYGRDRIYFVDTKLKSFTEKMKVLCKDKVNMSADVKWIGSFDVSSPEKIEIIKEKVPATKGSFEGQSGYSLDFTKFYKTAMKDIIRNSGRVTISPYITDAIPENRLQIEKTIRKLVIERLLKLNYPVKTSDVLVSNLDFDEVQTKQRQAIKNAELEDELKAAQAKASVAQAKRDADIAREKGKALIERAKAQAAANKIIDSSLTPAIDRKSVV